MNKLALVRYGEHENGHLNDKGVKEMVSVGEKLKPIVGNKNICIIAAEVARATESAEIISKNLGMLKVKSFSELYASEDKPVNLDSATKVIDATGKKCDIVVAVVSREYIETLPDYILHSLGVQKTTETHLDRGEILILDYIKKDITYLR